MSVESAGPGFVPNFSCTHSVTLDHAIDKVFTMIGTSSGHERVCRLSSMCSAFELLAKDTVSLQPGASLNESHARLLPASDSGLPRQHFTMSETVPILFGIIKTVVKLVGTLTWDEENKLALYETAASGSGILVWKIREFKKVGEDKTLVTETIQGQCPALLKSIVQSQASKAHA